MAKKTVKKSSKKIAKSAPRATKVKSYNGLKAYIILGLICVIAIGVVIFITVWNNVNYKNSIISFVTLPQTGDVAYYSNCYIDNTSGILNYPNKYVEKCTYRGPQTDGYDFETTSAYLKCTLNNLVQMNVCTEGKAK